MRINNLVWSPIKRAIEKQIRDGDELILLIVPFIRTDALRMLYELHKKKVKLKVVCRWRPEDIISGAADIEVYSYLKEIGSKLFLHPDIHLKLYVFNSNVSFITSGNLTLRGMGYSKKSNIEIGNIVSLAPYDWERIYRIIDTSCPVDDSVYDRYRTFLDQQPKVKPITYPSDLYPKVRKYTISSLPATENPVKLSEYYFNPITSKYSPEQVRRALHDLVTFEIPAGLANEEFEQLLSESFRKSPFVRDFVELLEREKSLHFGAVNKWIQQKCEDVPLPYKWEIKENTHIFYDWLQQFIPEITWNRPKHSQVIYWNET